MNGSRESIWPFFQDPDLLRAKCVDKIRLVGRYENLRRMPFRRGVISECLRQTRQKLVIQAVFRLLNADKRRWFRVFQEKEIGKNLQGTVGHLLRVKWIVEASIVESKQHAPILGPLCVNLGDAGDAIGDPLKDGGEPVIMLSFHELYDVAQIV